MVRPIGKGEAMDLEMVPIHDENEMLWKCGYNGDMAGNAEEILPLMDREGRELALKVMRQAHDENPQTHCDYAGCHGVEMLSERYSDDDEEYTYRGHKWGSENVKIVNILRKLEPDKWGNDLFFDICYSFGSPHTWFAGYAVNTRTGEIQCYVS